MERNAIQYAVNLALTISFLSVLVTGIMKFSDLFRLLGLGYPVLPLQQITTIHEWSGITMAALVFIHLALNWGWIKGMTGRILRGEGK